MSCELPALHDHSLKINILQEFTGDKQKNQHHFFFLGQANAVNKHVGCCVRCIVVIVNLGNDLSIALGKVDAGTNSALSYTHTTALKSNRDPESCIWPYHLQL